MMGFNTVNSVWWEGKHKSQKLFYSEKVQGYKEVINTPLLLKG